MVSNQENDEDMPKLEKGKTYFFICYSLVAGGKSSFFKITRELIEYELSNDFNCFYVSTDEIKGTLIQQHIQKYPNSTEDEAFNKTQKVANNIFDQQIRKFLTETSNEKINIILVDKNFPNGVGQFSNVFVMDHPG